MLEGLADLLVGFLDLLWFTSSAKKKRYHKVERIVNEWTKKVGLHLQYEYKDEKVRSFNVVDDAGNKYQIWIEILKWGRVKVSCTNNESEKNKKSWMKKSKISNLTKVLYEGYGMVEQWIFQSGNTRTVYK